MAVVLGAVAVVLVMWLGLFLFHIVLNIKYSDQTYSQKRQASV